MQLVRFGSLYLRFILNTNRFVNLVLIVTTITYLGYSETATAERLWSRSSADWTPRTVSIGVHGTQVLGPVEYGQDHVSLLSGFSPDPAMPVWTDNITTAGTNMLSASAEHTDTHVVLTQIVQNNQNHNRMTQVRKYRSTSSTADWTYDFTGNTSGLAQIGITPDGSKIVAAVIYPFEQRLAIAVFGPNSSTPTNTYNINYFGVHLRAFSLSDDGSLLYVSSNGYVYIYNLLTGSIVTQVVLTGMFDAHAFCGNGRGFAWGEFNRVHLYEMNAQGEYVNTWNDFVSGPWLADRLALSNDCSTLVMGHHRYDDNLIFPVRAIDLPTKTTTMSDTCQGTGTQQNVISEIDINKDGSKFVVGAWGDQGNLCAELRVYNRDTNLPTLTYNYPGSVHGLDMDESGNRVAVAVKPVHANTFAGGGSFDLFATDNDDLRLVGIPRPGAIMSVRLRNMPGNSPTKLLTSATMLGEPVNMGSLGDLWLPRQLLTRISFTNTNALGEAVGTYTIPNGPVGQDMYMQGIAMLPPILSGNAVHLKTLP